MWEFLVNGGVLILGFIAMFFGVCIADTVGNIRDGRPQFNRKLV